MATVLIEGVFMNAEIKSTTFDGNTKTALYVDVYQRDSTSAEKTVQLKTEDIELMNTLKSDYDFGSMIQVKAGVNAYKNKAYFKLLEVI